MDISDKINLAFKHFQENDLEQARGDCLEILQLQLDNSEILHLLGVTYYHLGEYENAIESLNKALQRDPKNADIYYDIGNVLQDKGEMDGALNAYEKAVELEPDHAEAHNNLGIVLHDRGRLDDAIGHYQKALELTPQNASIHNNIGLAFQEKEEFEKAIAHYGRAIQLDPEYPDVYFNMGNIFMKEENLDAAYLYYSKSVQLNPNLTEGFSGMAYILVRKGKYSEAIPFLRRVLMVNPGSAEVHNNLGSALSEIWQLPEAVFHLRKAVQLDPEFAEAYNNLGNTVAKAGKVDEGIGHIKRALQLDPEMVEAIDNLGNLYKERGQFREASTCYLKALLLSPGNADAHLDAALLDLSMGHFQKGWEGYEWRWKAKGAKEPKFKQPLWDGSTLAGRKLFIFAEQGIGDEIMFSSCIPEVLRQAEQCIVECDGRLMPLFERSFPAARIIGRLENDVYPSSLPSADWRIGVASLPGFLRPDLKSFPAQRAYLITDNVKLAEWEKRYRELGDGLKVGISWRGGSTPDVIRERSIKLERWADLFSIPGVNFINLQYGDCADELRGAEEKLGVKIHDWKDSDPLRDLDNFAAKIAALDLVISVDNSTVHMAGALGVPVWVLLPYVCEWRWMRDFEDTPWYESMRLFRQKDPGNWNDVFGQILSVLKDSAIRKNVSDIAVAKSYKYEIGKEKKSDGSSQKVNKPRCAVIIPIGPGHGELSEKALASVKESFLKDRGIFSEIVPLEIDDREGRLGRSKARNTGVRKAAELGVEWLFFLDADDLMAPHAFEYVLPYLDGYDAIWGSIWAIEHDEETPKERPGQLPFLTDIRDVLSGDPVSTLQIGHFVRTSVADETPFDETLNTGEDFDYYLRAWEKYKCIKIPLPFFYNQRGHHSSGPKSATGREWRQNVEPILREYRKKFGIPESVEQ